MKKVNITNSFLEGFRPILTRGSESIILYKDDILAKLIKPEFLKDDRQKIIEELPTLQYDGVITPDYLLYERNKFIGYVMHFLKECCDICDLLNNKTIDFNKRKELMIKLSQIFDYFYKNNFAYYDIHGGNILFSNGQINIIDLDGGIFKGYENNGIDFNTAIRLQTKNLCKFIISFLHNLDIDDIQKVPTSYYINLLPYTSKKIYTHAFDQNYRVFDGITESLNDLDEESFSIANLVIKKKI
jgi:tRNA A-37 threonylcarbamoyl transferase component Bud32